MSVVQYHTYNRGTSLIEVLVAAAIMVLIFGGLIAGFRYMLVLLADAKAQSTALAYANERLEYVHSLQYNSVGTVGGIPEGSIPQTATYVLNGITYYERMLIEYVDASEDGVGAGDTNGILADYKRVKVEYSWNNRGATSSIALVTNIVPPGIETTAGGGTLTVNVFDALVQPVDGAEVRIYNDTTTSTIDTTKLTDVGGVAMFAGAPAAANYQITVTKSDYSTDQTYSATATNTSPVTPHVAVIESAVSTMNFQIDELSDLTIETVNPPTTAHFEDFFADTSLIATTTLVDINGTEAILTGGAGSYAASGVVMATTTSPGTFDEWGYFNFNGTTTSSTSLIVRLYVPTGIDTYALIPDSDLAGNSVGFTSGPVDISALSTVTYPDLVLGATLQTSDANYTPQLGEWFLEYTVSETSVANVPFTLRGAKTIGTDASSSAVYKYEESHTTDGSGNITINDLEWDVYSLTLGTGLYDIKEACGGLPYSLDPGVTETLKLILESSVANSLRVHVKDAVGDPIIGADVTLSRTGYTGNDTTSVCGQTFFNSGLITETDYQVDVSAPGYTSEVVTDVTVDGASSIEITLSS